MGVAATPDSSRSNDIANSGYDPKLSNKEFSKAISVLGIKKANTHLWQLMLLGILAGIYIGLGAQLYLVAISSGLGKIVGGIVFSVGLVLVLIAGAELFTGNVIMLVGTVTGLFSFRKLLRNWTTVYVANFLGSILTAILIWQGGLLGSVDKLNALGALAVSVSKYKLSLTFGECVIRGILCNALVILAIIMSTMAKDIISKIVCIIFPIMTFVACGFEHCVANMFLIPLGLLAGGATLSEMTAMFHNIVPVTIGNVIGGVAILLIHPNRIRQLKILRSSSKI